MAVAQKRLARGEDVLRRPVIFSKAEIYFWDWFVSTQEGMFEWIEPGEKWSLWKVALTGPLPGNRRLAKQLVVDVTWDGEWVVSEPLYSIHSGAPTLRKAMARFRRIFSGYLDSLSEHEDRPMSQWLIDQLAYLREMIHEEPA
jgi:hypothetical protein